MSSVESPSTRYSIPSGRSRAITTVVEGVAVVGIGIGCGCGVEVGVEVGCGCGVEVEVVVEVLKIILTGRKCAYRL